MQLTIKHSPIGKPAKPINPSHGWIAADLTPSALIAHIVSGKPFAVGQYTGGHRHGDNFLGSSVIALDFDGVTTGKGQDKTKRPYLTADEYAQLLNDPFIVQNAFAVIQSASSKPDAYRARVLFALDDCIGAADTYKAVVSHVLTLTALASDKACVDAARFFYGGLPGRVADYIALDNRLSLADLLKDIAALNAPKTVKKGDLAPSHDYSDATDLNAVEQALSYIPGDGLEYDEWLKVLMALSNLPNGLALAEQWTHDDQMTLAARFASFKGNGGISLNTLFWYAMQYGYRPIKAPSSRLDLSGLLDLPTDNQNTINSRFVNDALGRLDHAAIAIKSPIGTGKTEWLAQQLKGKSFLFVLHRVSLVENVTKRLNDAGLDVYGYRDIDLNTATPDRLIITANSLHKIASKGALKPFDVVVLDESEQLLAHLLGDTFKGQEGQYAYSLTQGFIAKAGQVIALDAHLTSLSIDFLERAKGVKPYVVVNTYQPQRGNMTIYPKPDQAIQAGLDHLASGAKVAFACDSKSDAKTLHETCWKRGYKAIVIHGDNSSHADVQALLADLDNELKAVDCFIYTSAVGTGVDIQTPFDCVYGVLRNMSITPQEQLQLIGRIRQAGDVVVGMQAINRTNTTDAAAIKNRYLDNLYDLCAKWGIHYSWHTGQGILTPDHAEFLNFACEVESLNNQAKQQPHDLFVDMASKEWNVAQLTDVKPIRSDLKEELTANADGVAAATKDQVLTAVVVSEEVYKQAVERGKGSTALSAGYTRGLYETFYQQPITSAIYDHAKAGGMTWVSNLVLLHSSLDRLKGLDQLEANDKLPLSKLHNYATTWQAVKVCLHDIFPGQQSVPLLHCERIAKQDIDDRLTTFSHTWGIMQADRLLGARVRAKTAIGQLQGLLGTMGLKFKQEPSNGAFYYRLHGLEVMTTYALTRLYALDELKYEFEIAALCRAWETTQKADN